MSNRTSVETNSRSERDESAIDRSDRLTQPTSSADNRRNLPALVRKRPLAPNHGNRPVEPSHLDLVESNLPGHRPVSASPLKVSGTVSAYGVRPIGVSELKIAETITLSGHRPVGADSLAIATANTDWLPGNRPVASNDLGEDSTLMGYLD